MVVCANDGLDEFTLSGSTHVAELKGGEVVEYDVAPKDVGLAESSLEGLSVASAEESLALINDALGKQVNPEAHKAADIIAFNAGAAVYVAGIADSLEEGVRMAEDAVGSGLAKAKIQELASFTHYQKAS